MEIRTAIILATIAGFAIVGANQVKGTPDDTPVAWMIRHPRLVFVQLTDPPPGGRQGSTAALDWTVRHADLALEVLSDPPPHTP
jgi:hypothetical protein